MIRRRQLLPGRHEVKVGFGYRTADVESSYTAVPGNGIMTYHDGYPNMIAEITAWNEFTSTGAKYMSGFRRRHHLVRPPHAEPRRPLGSPVVLGVRVRRRSGNPLLPTLLPT